MVKIKRISLMTSGGDAPGMNAAIRAVVRTAVFNNLKVIAVNNGYEGLINGDYAEINAESVSNIIQKGGTIINSSRSERFKEYSNRKIAYRNLKNAGIAAVIVIGGNGSLAGANIFTKEFDIPFIGIPKTIDNDIHGTDYSIGFDTATNTAIEAIDKIRDTANSHHRLFFVEVMGRNAGFIAVQTGVASGSEAILVPEIYTNEDMLIARLEKGWKRRKSSLIVVVAEGAVKGGAMRIAERVKEKFKYYDTRVTILGHIQRGGNPSCFDRMIAGRLGNYAVKILLEGKRNVMVALKNNKLTYTPFEKAASRKHSLHKDLLKLAYELSY